MWALYGKSAAATGEVTANSGTPAANITTVVGDFVIATVAYRSTTTAANMSWTTLTKRFDGPADGAVRMFSGADYIATTTSTAIGGTIANYSSESALVGVAYR